MIRNIAGLGAAVSLLVLAGCASAPQPLYHWEGYQQQVYERFESSSSTEEQIAVLEASVQHARAADRPLPPGFHAHLGMLYADIGKLDQVRQQFETEKSLYPESTTYMDFLLRKFDQ